jgi:glycosyltransferase involved in cell wall biosynthesis
MLAMRIAIVMPLLPETGASGFALQGWRTAAALGGRGHDVTVLVPGDCEPADTTDAAPVTLRCLHEVKSSMADADQHLVEASLATLVRDRDPWDIVQVRGWRTAGFAGLACRSQRWPFPIVGHTSTLGFSYEFQIRPRLIAERAGTIWSRYRRSWAKRRDYVRSVLPLERAVRHLSALSTVTPHNVRLARLLYATPAERLFLVPDGIPAHDFAVAEPLPSEPRLLFAAALTRRKGAHLLLQSLTVLARRHPALTLRIVGDGPERASLEALVDRHQLRDRVAFAGSLPYAALCGEVRRCGVFVNPTMSNDGYDTVQIMAMLAGRPIVTPRTANNCTLLSADAATFFRLGSTGSLAGALDRVLTLSASERAAAGAAARARALRGFTVETMAHASEGMFSTIVRRQRNAA